MLEDVALIAAMVVVSIQALFFLAFVRGLLVATRKPSKGQLPPVSVVVCGRNAEELFRENLPYLLNQDYPQFEVVAVNDRSVDDTRFLLEHLQTKFAHLKVVNVKENDRFWAGKKFALTLGIKASSHEHLLLTDADCQPASRNWLRNMASGFDNEKSLVLGFGAHERGRGLASLLTRFETLQTALLYASAAVLNKPYMGVGRNLAYRKSLFYGALGFGRHMDVASGDDDLFVQQVGTRSNTAVVMHKEAFTWSKPKATMAEWMLQKRRHLSASPRYRWGTKFILGLYSSTTLLWYGLLLLLPWAYSAEMAIVLGARLVLALVALGWGARKLTGIETLPALLVIEPLLAVLQGVLLLRNTIQGQPARWN
jgi:glycosyltransferase involved in cell wall biosynthesis